MNELDRLIELKRQEKEHKINTLLLLGASSICFAEAAVDHVAMFAVFGALTAATAIGSAIKWDNATNDYTALEGIVTHNFNQALDTWQTE